HAARNAIRDRFPGLAVVLRLVDEWIAIVHLMKIDGEISCAGFVARRLDIADRAPRRQVGNVLCHVGPVLTAITCELDETVIRSGPDQYFFFWRLSDREDNREILNTDIVVSQTTAKSLIALIIGGEVRPVYLPT